MKNKEIIYFYSMQTQTFKYNYFKFFKRETHEIIIVSGSATLKKEIDTFEELNEIQDYLIKEKGFVKENTVFLAFNKIG